MVRLSAMGDILHALPAVTALRKAHPGWVIDWVIEPRWRALLAADDGNDSTPDWLNLETNPARPVVNGLHLAPTKDWRKAPFARSTISEIRACEGISGRAHTMPCSICKEPCAPVCGANGRMQAHYRRCPPQRAGSTLAFYRTCGDPGVA